MEKKEVNSEALQKMQEYYNQIETTRGNLFSSIGYNEFSQSEKKLIAHKAYFGSTIPTKKEIQSKIYDADKILYKLQYIKKELNKESGLNDEQLEMIEKFLNAQINELEYHKTILPIEAEKAGFISRETKEEKNARIKKKENLEEKLYGPRITEKINKERYEKVLDYFRKITTNEGFNALSDENKRFWNKKIVQGLLNNDLNISDSTGKKQQEILEDPEKYHISEELIIPITETLLQIEGIDKNDTVVIQEEEKRKKLERVEEERKNGDKRIKYLIPETWENERIYNEIKNSYPNDRNKLKIIKKNSGSMSVSIKKDDEGNYSLRQICLGPAIQGEYNLKTVLNILADHEIGTHILTQTNNTENFNIKSFDRSKIEEGIATVNQNFSANKNIQEYYETSIGDIGQAIGENFDQKDTFKILYIINRIQGYEPETAKKKAQTRSRRIKIGVPEGGLGTRRLDMRYGAGKNIIKELEELTKTKEGREKLQKMIKGFYLTRLGYNDLQNIDKILENIVNLDGLEVSYPIFAGKILYNKLFSKHGKIDKNIMLKDDLRKIIAENNIPKEKLRLIVEIKNLIEHDQTFQKEKP